jgi:predicted Zn-dependent protease
MRQDRRVARQLAGQSYFLEGCAEMGRHHRAQAEAAFKKVTDYDLPTPGAVLAMAKSMVGLGFSDSAQRLLVRKQELFRKEPGYWQLLYSAAIGCKDEDTLLLAARELHALASTNWHAKYAYAAALLTLRVQPDEAVKLTRELLDQQPEPAGAKINHCFALIQNNRPQQAQAMLETIDRTEFGVLQSNAFSQLEFELYCSLGDLRHAREVSYRVDTNLLFRSEARWFEDALRRITPPKRTAAEG